MRSVLIGLVLGIWWLQNQANLVTIPILLASVALVCPCIFFASRRLRGTVRVCVLMLCGGLFGMMWASGYAHYYLSDTLPSSWEGRDITLIGTINNLPSYSEQGVRFNFLVEHTVAADREPSEPLPIVPKKIALSWYSAFHTQGTQAVHTVQPGERWQLTVRLKRPHGNANPFGFDYEVWLLEQGIRATGTVRADAQSEFKNQQLSSFVWGFSNLIERFRAGLRDKIFTLLPDQKYAGVLVALVIGDQRAIDQSDWTIFNRTGIGHLVSISGLHITMVAGLFASLILFLWRHSFFTRAQLPLLCPAQKIAALAGVIMALAYVLLAGFGIPAQRTLYMLSVVAAAFWFGRLTSVSHVLCLALGVVVLLDPWAVLWPGFWLSFGAVAIILYVSMGRIEIYHDESGSFIQKIWHQIRPAIRTQYAVTIGLIPLTMLLFGQISLISPLANAIAIPLVSFIITPLALIGSVLPMDIAIWVLKSALFLVNQLVSILTWLSSSPFAVWNAPISTGWMFICAMIGMLWMMAPSGWPLRWIGIIGWFPLLMNMVTAPQFGQMWATVFDVGQGTAVLIETAHHRLLYDTGPAYSPESDGGSRVIVPYLHARGIQTLEGMVVSHSDIDHSGGALSVLDAVPVAWVSSSLPASSQIMQTAHERRRCEAGQSWSWDGVQFDMIHPDPVSYESEKWKPNARSCTVKITVGHGSEQKSILLPGDIEAVQEIELLGSHRDRLSSTVLLAPHHGSGTSSTAAFLKVVQPELALFQVGYRNRYGHPKQEVYDRYGAMGIQRIRTDQSGAIHLKFENKITVNEYRTEHARYWYERENKEKK